MKKALKTLRVFALILTIVGLAPSLINPLGIVLGILNIVFIAKKKPSIVLGIISSLFGVPNFFGPGVIMIVMAILNKKIKANAPEETEAVEAEYVEEAVEYTEEATEYAEDYVG